MNKVDFRAGRTIDMGDAAIAGIRNFPKRVRCTTLESGGGSLRDRCKCLDKCGSIERKAGMPAQRIAGIQFPTLRSALMLIIVLIG